MRRITTVSRMLRDLYDPDKLGSDLGLWSAHRMRLAADNFLVFASWVAFPKQDTIVQLKSRIASYVSVFATGAYDELPSQELGEADGLLRQSLQSQHWRRATGLFALFLLVLAPLFAFAVAIAYFRFELHTALQPAAAIVYSAWIVLCLLTYMDRLAPEAKGFMLDVIRLVFRRS